MEFQVRHGPNRSDHRPVRVDKGRRTRASAENAIVVGVGLISLTRLS